MKYVTLFLLLFFFSTALFAQDTLVKRDGARIAAKVLEVNPSEIRYKRSDSPDGPLYTINPWELRSIIYAGGRVESYETVQSPPPPPPSPVFKEDLSIQPIGKHYYYKEHKIAENDMLAIATKRNDPKTNLMIKKVQEKKLIQNCALIAGAGLFTAGLYVYATNGPSRGGRRGSPVSNTAKANSRQNGEFMMLGALGCAAVSITFKFDRTRHPHMVVELYNQSLIH
jgi:hypothetical protein